MMKQVGHPFQHPYRRSALALALVSAFAPASLRAQSPSSDKLDRIEITGSLIRKASDEGSLPMSSVKSEELQARGHTEFKDFMLELPQASSLGSFAGTAGPITSLRGFGPMRTLTLLNGRRLAKEPLTNQYVSGAVFPRMAVQRTDILRDGASSAYGSDAISGVQAFYTYNTFNGVGLKIEALEPQRSGGGDSKSVGAIAGTGNLAKDGWNAYAAVEIQRRTSVLREDRPNLTDGAALNQLGISTVPGVGAFAMPGNFTDPTNVVAAQRTLRHNPYFASGCLPPYSVPSVSGGRQTCFLDANETYTAFSNGGETLSLYGRATWAISADHTLGLEYNLGKFTVDQVNVPASLTVRLASSHPYYPGNGIVPAVSGLALGGRPVDVLWSVADLGSRIRSDHHTNQRFVVSGEGRLGQWDYRSALNLGTSERDTRAGSGWASVTGLATVQGAATTLFLDPRLNPFGIQTAAGRDLLVSRSLSGQTLRLIKAANSSIDFTGTRELMELTGGQMVLAVGGEVRRDQWEPQGQTTNDLAPSLNRQIDILGGDAQALGAGTSTTTKISRGITSAFAELEAPVSKTLTLNASVRADQYKDLGETSINPKVAFRYQPAKGLVLRGSANTGYRAPALPEIYGKETELTALATFDDPINCPTINGVKTPATGFTALQVCSLIGKNQITKVPANSGIKPETSKSFTFGAAFEPARNLSVTADYWSTEIKDVIGNRSTAFILANPGLYAGLFNRAADGTLDSNAVTNVPANLGAMRAAGIDLSVKYAMPKTSYGGFTAGLDVAYLTKWEASSPEVNGGAWLSALGEFNDVVPVNPNAGLSNGTRGMNHRWRHTASIAWAMGPWNAQLSQRYQSKIRDQNLAARTGAGTSGPRDVSAYEQWNLTTSYAGFKNVKLGLAINNLFNVDPPQTNHNGYLGYVTSSVDVLGRAYRLTVDYAF